MPLLTRFGRTDPSDAGHLRRVGWIPPLVAVSATTRAPDSNSRAERHVAERHGSAFSPRVSREFCQNVSPSSIRGRGECRMPDAPAASCAHGVTSMHTSIHSESPESTGIPRAMVYGLYRALPGDRLSCHRRRRSCLHRLDTSVGVSGPHVFAVRLKHPRQEHHPRPPHPAPRW